MSDNTKHISQNRLRVLGNRAPRKIFGLQREKNNRRLETTAE